FRNPLFQLRKIDIEHHHDEKEENGDGSHIDNDQDHRQKFRPEQHKQPGGIKEGEDQKEHRVDGIAGGNHHEGGGNHDRREKIKKNKPATPIPHPTNPPAGTAAVCLSLQLSSTI